VQVALHRRHTGRRQDVRAHQVDFSANLPREIGEVDAGLLGENERQFLHRADGLQCVAARTRLFSEASNRGGAHECDVMERVFGEPRIDECVLELGTCLRRHGDRTANVPHLVDESTRDLGASGSTSPCVRDRPLYYVRPTSSRRKRAVVGPQLRVRR
jgi:hypothetical protein